MVYNSRRNSSLLYEKQAIMGLKQFIGGIGLVMLFAIACFIFMIKFITVNNPTSLVSSDPIINSTLNSFQDRATELQKLGEDSKNALASDEPTLIYLFLIFYSAFAIPLQFLTFLVLSIGTIGTTMFSLFFGKGSSPFYIILGVVNGILIITIVIAIIKAIRTGDSG